MVETLLPVVRQVRFVSREKVQSHIKRRLRGHVNYCRNLVRAEPFAGSFKFRKYLAATPHESKSCIAYRTNSVPRNQEHERMMLVCMPRQSYPWWPATSRDMNVVLNIPNILDGIDQRRNSAASLGDVVHGSYMVHTWTM